MRQFSVFALIAIPLGLAFASGIYARLTGNFANGLWNETLAQDLIEYALMAGFAAVAAGAFMPGVTSEISVIFSKVTSALIAAGS